MGNHILIFDTTLRDGEQAPGFSMTTEQKLRLALQLERLGVDVMEAGFPVASDGDFESVRQIAKTIRHCSVAGLCRTRLGDIDRAWDALKHAARPRIHTFIATSDIHLEHKLKMTRDQALNEAVRAVRHAKTYTNDVEFSAEDAVRSDPEYLRLIVEAAIDAGATTVNIPDTVGYAMPDEFGKMISALIRDVPNIHNAVVSVHCHNDLGLAVANSLAAVANGACQVECTVNGIGERAGNASLEEVAMSLAVRRDLFRETSGVNTHEIFRTSRLLCSLTGTTVQRNKAIVGENAFAHEAGIHQHGVMCHAETYEIMTPESVGVPESTLVLGKHSGRHALGKRYKELGYTLGKEELNTAYDSFKALADKKKAIYDADLIAIIESTVHDVPETYVLDNLQVISGSTLTPTATVQLRCGDDVTQDSSIGDGPVDAVFRAVDRITGQIFSLVSYSLNAVSKGKDAIGEVTLRIKQNGHSFSGRGASTDVVEASARAYLDAVNRAVHAIRPQKIEEEAL